jgi:hypothetical protein
LFRFAFSSLAGILCLLCCASTSTHPADTANDFAVRIDVTFPFPLRGGSLEERSEFIGIVFACHGTTQIAIIKCLLRVFPPFHDQGGDQRLQWSHRISHLCPLILAR